VSFNTFASYFILFNITKLKKIMKKLAFLIILFAISITACNKDKSKTDLLTDSVWIEINPEDACNSDDELKFNDDNTLKLTAGDLKCDFDLGDISGTWKFLSDETELELSLGTPFGIIKDTVEIITLTETSFTWKDSDGETTKFKHK